MLTITTNRIKARPNSRTSTRDHTRILAYTLAEICQDQDDGAQTPPARQARTPRAPARPAAGAPLRALPPTHPSRASLRALRALYGIALAIIQIWLQWRRL